MQEANCDNFCTDADAHQRLSCGLLSDRGFRIIVGGGFMKRALSVGILAAFVLGTAAGGAYFIMREKHEDRMIIKSYVEDTVVTEAPETSGHGGAAEITVEVDEKNEAGRSDGSSEETLQREEPLDEELGFAADYFFSFLSEDEAYVCRQLLTGFYNMDETIYIKEGVIDSSEITELLEVCTASAPLIDYIDSNYMVSVDNDGFVTSVNVTYNLSEDEVNARREATEARADAIVSGFGEDWDDYTKYKFIHDELILGCTYEESSGNDCYTAYGCLVNGKAVCEGYSRALMTVCERAGIPCVPVIGEGFDDNGSQSHVWNKVKLDGDWYATDLTWDDPIFDGSEDYVRYDYFAVTDEEMDRSHVRGINRYFTEPVCTEVYDDYYIHNGYYTDSIYSSSPVVERAVSDTIAAGGEFARIKCSDREVFDQTLQWIFGDSTGSTEIFGYITENNENAPGVVYDSNSYSVLNNPTTFTISIRLHYTEPEAEKE